MNDSQNNQPEGPRHISEGLEDLDALLGDQPDPERAENARRTSLGAEVSELRQRRDDTYEVIATDDGDTEAAVEGVKDTIHAIDQAKQELEESVRRHPSNPSE